eukprot:326135-Pelagomonas_calceolata.AAC.3
MVAEARCRAQCMLALMRLICCALSHGAPLFFLRAIEVIKRLPNLKKLDGIPVDVDEREQASLSK